MRHLMLRLAAPVALFVGSALLVGASCNQNSNEPVGFQLFTSPQVSPVALSADGSLLAVANTTSNTVEFMETGTMTTLNRVPVGVEPVTVAFRPGHQELWVSNHVSDTVSVIDLNPANPTSGNVIATVQNIDSAGVTSFDEPTGIAFTADGEKAYVALSSINRIAVVDADLRLVTGNITVRAQDPRAITVRNGLLYVAAFEALNQTELSVCNTLFPSGGVGEPCSLGLIDVANFVIDNPNIPDGIKNIVVNPSLPDRGLFVYDTTTDTEIAGGVVSGVGTLLYGLAVDSAGRAYVTLTEARNADNGAHGENLIDLDNRMFLNQVAAVTCSNPGGCGAVSHFDLEPLPPSQPGRANALGTPYGVAISGDDSTVVATAMGTSRLFTMSTGGAVLDIMDLDDSGLGGSDPSDDGQQIPRGVALASNAGTGAPETAYVLNSLENTVSVVDVSDPNALVHVSKHDVGDDPTPDNIRRGRIAFMSALTSDQGTFSCESCHPDGNTDQLLWRIGGDCSAAGCDPGDEPRTTMPVRGLKNTLPLHWDGTLGDPFGGGNGAGGSGTNCALGPDGDDQACFVNLVEASTSGVMCDQAVGPCNPGGNQLTVQQMEDMADFLASVVYPPPRKRRADDAVTAQAVNGFRDFFTDQGDGTIFGGTITDPDTCADSTAGCHELPLGVATNSSTLGDFDAPTMRGMTDRFIHFSIGITAPLEILELANDGINIPFIITSSPLEPSIQWDPNVGYREETTFGAAFAVFEPVYDHRPLDSFQMFEEASTGFSGAQGRQVTLNVSSTAGGALALTEAIMDHLELADERGLVNLRAVGVRDFGGGTFTPVTMTYRPDATYTTGNGSVSLTHAQMLAEAQAGTLVVTLTGDLRSKFGDLEFRQPLITVNGNTNTINTGDPQLPNYTVGSLGNELAAVDVRGDAQVILNGVPDAGATITCVAGSFSPYCDSGRVNVTLSGVPGNGLHLLQVQNDRGPISPELPICVGSSASTCQ